MADGDPGTRPKVALCLSMPFSKVNMESLNVTTQLSSFLLYSLSPFFPRESVIGDQVFISTCTRYSSHFHPAFRNFCFDYILIQLRTRFAPSLLRNRLCYTEFSKQSMQRRFISGWDTVFPHPIFISYMIPDLEPARLLVLKNT